LHEASDEGTASYSCCMKQPLAQICGCLELGEILLGYKENIPNSP